MYFCHANHCLSNKLETYSKKNKKSITFGRCCWPQLHVPPMPLAHLYDNINWYYPKFQWNYLHNIDFQSLNSIMITYFLSLLLLLRAFNSFTGSFKVQLILIYFTGSWFSVACRLPIQLLLPINLQTAALYRTMAALPQGSLPHSPVLFIPANIIFVLRL